MSLRRYGAPAAALAALAAAAFGVAGASASLKPAYCSLPRGPSNPSWAFHVGTQINGARGTYAHGRGTSSGNRATGLICQVDRGPGHADRQIILTITRAPTSHGYGVHEDGVLGNELTLPVRVSSTTDRRCPVGTRGSLRLFASYDGPRHDTVRFAFVRGCRTHRHNYGGPDVVVLVPHR